MTDNYSLGGKRRNAGSIGLASQSAWREHAIYLGADWLAVEFISRPNNFKDGSPTYEACTVKKALHDVIAEATLQLLCAESNHHNVATTAPKSLVPETVRNLFHDWRPLLNQTFERRLSVRGAAGDSHGPESDASVIDGAKAIGRLIGGQ